MSPPPLRCSPSASSSVTVDLNDKLDRELLRLGGIPITPTDSDSSTRPDDHQSPDHNSYRFDGGKDGEDAFLASIAQPTRPVPLTNAYHAAERNTFTPAQFTALHQSGTLPLFVYGHEQFPECVCTILGNSDPMAFSEKMTRAYLEGYNRYCARRLPFAAILPHDHKGLDELLNHVEKQPLVDGMLIFNLSAAEKAKIDNLLLSVEGEDADGVKSYSKEIVQVNIHLEGVQQLVPIRAETYVWAASALHLHIFLQDRKWSKELFMDWYRKEQAEVDTTAEEQAEAMDVNGDVEV